MRPHRPSRGGPAPAAPAPLAVELPSLLGGNCQGQAKNGSPMPTEPDLAISLRLDAYAPRAARSQVALVDRPSPDLRDAVMLITHDLVTRALRQGQFTSGEDIELRVWMPADIVRVEHHRFIRANFALLQKMLERRIARCALGGGKNSLGGADFFRARNHFLICHRFINNNNKNLYKTHKMNLNVVLNQVNKITVKEF